MAGFPLGGANQEEIPPTPFLFCQQEISLKGFELWKLQQQQQQLGHFSDTRKYGDEYEDKFILNINPSMAGSSSHMAIVGEERQSGSNSCQDCGNQAKKDCVHMRCRTCCQSRGFHCPTHVKSTWVPASRRRERQQQLATLHQLTQIPPKRLRSPDPTSSSLACTRITEPGSFPVEVNSPAVFRCVKVSSIDEGDDQYAYQTAVSIGGHVFRGILYDQGPENLTSGDDGGRNFINPTTASATNTSIALINPAATLYPPPLNAFMAGTQFFTHPRP